MGVAQRALAAQRTVTRLQAAGLTQQQALEALTPRPRPVEVLEPATAGRQRDEAMLCVAC